MTDGEHQRILRIARRQPHRAAFEEIARSVDALPKAEAAEVLAAIEADLTRWPDKTRSLVVGMRDAPSLTLMTSIVELVVAPLIEPATAWLARAPANVRRLTLVASPPRREAERFASDVRAQLPRFEALEGIHLATGHATTSLAARVVERPLTAFGARLGFLDDPRVLDQLDPTLLTSLELNVIDGIRPQWTSAEVASAVSRLPRLVELESVWVEPQALSELRYLERLRVLPRAVLDGPALEALFASLPRSLRRLAAPGIPGDALVDAFARFPALEEMSFVGSKLSADGVKRLVDSRALERLTKIELNGALEPDTATTLFQSGAPRALRELDLFGLDLGDRAIRALSAAPAWLENLVALDVQSIGPSSGALAALLDRLLDHAPSLVALSVGGNSLGPHVDARLGVLRERGVAIDVAVTSASPATTATAAPAGMVDAASSVADAWQAIDGWIAANGPVAGLNAPASAAVLAEAERAGVPASLRALHAAHDGGADIDLLGLGRILWWPLREIVAAGPTNRDGHDYFAFATPVEEGLADLEVDGALPSPDDDLDELLVVAADADEVLLLGRNGARDVVATSLAEGLARTRAALESGTRTIDENGRVVVAPARASAAIPRVSPLDAFVASIVERGALELRAGTTASDLAAALSRALLTPTTTTTKEVIAAFDSDLVDEVFLDDDELASLAELLVRQFG